MEALYTHHQKAACSVLDKPHVIVMQSNDGLFVGISYNNIIIAVTQAGSSSAEIKQRAEGTAGCMWLRVSYTGIINSLPVTPYNLPGVGVEALPHVTDISDLI